MGQVAPTLALLASVGLLAASASAQIATPAPPRDRQMPPATGTARISGRVVAADTGRPIRRALVRLTSSTLRESRTVNTDQNGYYEFAELPAGTFTVMASRSGYVTMGYRQARAGMPPATITIADRVTRDGIDIALSPGGVITGRVVDEFGEPVSEVPVSARRLQFTVAGRRPVNVGPSNGTNDTGEFRIYGLQPGEYYVVATPRGQASPMDIRADRAGYGVTYHPSAPDAASAQRVIVRAGDTVTNVTITLASVQLARVSGIVLDAEGKPMTGGSVGAMPRDEFGPPVANAAVRPDGTFVFAGLPPGEYLLRSIGAGPFDPRQPPSFATAQVTVNGADLSTVALEPLVPVVIRGRLTGDPATLMQVRSGATTVIAIPLTPVAVGGPMQPPSLQADLSFELHVMPGLTALRLGNGLNGLAVQAVRWNGQEVSRGFEVQPGAPVEDVEVDIVPASARFAISVASSQGTPVGDANVLVFTQDESRWGSPLPSYGAAGRTNEQGRYESPPLVAGAYYVALTRPLDPGESNDPEFLEAIRAGASRINISDGETASITLRVPER